ncbi:uncharacterized protein PHLOEM PROTEIN 2-LIKE A4-like [Castanea sativa]|uniref:uncharacterized protein PHLOEM PROTEIN 2-LIKE A4-like n=1 Tax=Castanea sativa TaxID=21020 RepID=UPI003F651B3E
MASQIDVKGTSETGTKSVKQKENAARKGITRPPLNFLSIFKEARIPIDISSPDKLYEQLYDGVFVEEGNKLKFFVDKKLNKNGFVYFARALYICWADTPQYWTWTKEKDTSGEDIEVAELLSVCWLEITGEIWTVKLTPGTLYEIVFVIMIKEGGNISNYTLQLTIDGSKGRSQSLKDTPRNEWLEMQVGEFMMAPERVGWLKFRLEEYSPDWKNGLVVKCVIIRPKTNGPKTNSTLLYSYATPPSSSSIQTDCK